MVSEKNITDLKCFCFFKCISKTYEEPRYHCCQCQAKPGSFSPMLFKFKEQELLNLCFRDLLNITQYILWFTILCQENENFVILSYKCKIGFFILCRLQQCFTHVRGHINHVETSLNADSNSVGFVIGPQISAFLVSFQVIPVLLVQGPHFYL